MFVMPETESSENHLSYVVGSASVESETPRINLAVGPSCYVRCTGCYNLFGETKGLGGLITASEITDFAAELESIGVHRAILSGGDPLSHPEIVDIVRGLDDHMEQIRMDSVGTPFLPESANPLQLVYKGRGETSRIDPRVFTGLLTLINIPIDGPDEGTAQIFRHGRRGDYLEEATLIAQRIREADIDLGINSVVSAANIDKLSEMRDLVQLLGASQWRLFQFDPEGPNNADGRENTRALAIENDDFRIATEAIMRDSVTSASGLVVRAGGLATRGTYNMVNDAGIHYQRTPGGDFEVIGHITHDRAKVIARIREAVHLVHERYS